MRFWTLSTLLHLGFFAAFFYLKSDLMRPDLREKIDGDVIVLGFVYESPPEKDNILLKPIEADKQTASKSLREQVRSTAKQKARPKPAQGFVKVAAAQALESPVQTAINIFETKKANVKKHQRVASGVLQQNESSVMMAAATTLLKSSALSAPRYKICSSRSRSGAKPSGEQKKNQENKQITITNLVGVHPAHRAALQGQVTSISALLGAKPVGRQTNIATLLNGNQTQSTQISCK